MVIRVPCATRSQFLCTISLVRLSSQRRRLMWRKTDFPRNGKSWTTISLWKPWAIKMRCFSSLGVSFFSSKYKWSVPSSVLWETRSKWVINSSGSISFNRSIDNSNADRFPAKIELLFQFTHNFWDWSGGSSPLLVKQINLNSPAPFFCSR